MAYQLPEGVLQMNLVRVPAKALIQNLVVLHFHLDVHGPCIIMAVNMLEVKLWESLDFLLDLR